MELRIEMRARKLRRFIKSRPRKVGVQLLRSLKRATRSAHTDAGRVLAKDTGMKVGQAKKRLRRVDPTGQTLTGKILASLKRIPLILMGARGPLPSRGRGRVTVRGKGGGRRTVPGAFISQMPGGHLGVFKRERGQPRLPIHELRGPSAGRVIDLHKEGILERALGVFSAEFDRLLARVLRVA